MRMTRIVTTQTKPNEHLFESYALRGNPGLATDEELDEVRDQLIWTISQDMSAEQPWRSTVHLGSIRDFRCY